MQEIDLKKSLIDLCQILEIEKLPSIGWMEKKNTRFDGVYDYKSHRIEVSRSVRQELIDTLIVHELCHAVLLRAGYHSTGHSAVFLATYHLMLIKVGLEGTESIEGAAVGNWNKWTPWPYWYRHLTEAQEIANSMRSQEGFVESSSAQAMARAVMDSMKYKKWMPLWVVYRWHEIIADTRGNWYAIWQLSRILFFVGIGLACTPFILVKKIGVAVFGLSVIGLWVISKVFKLNSNVSRKMVKLTSLKSYFSFFAKSSARR